MTPKETKVCEDMVRRMLTHTAHESDMEYLATFPESEIKEIVYQVSNTISGNNGQGKWTPNHGRKHYGA